MPSAQRQKGKKGELEVVHLAWEFGFTEARRSGDTGQIDGDVERIPGVYLEVRRRERVDIDRWCAEVEAEAPGGKLPVVTWRRSGEPWRAATPLRDLFALVVEARGAYVDLSKHRG